MHTYLYTQRRIQGGLYVCLAFPLPPWVSEIYDFQGGFGPQGVLSLPSEREK